MLRLEQAKWVTLALLLSFSLLGLADDAPKSEDQKRKEKAEADKAVYDAEEAAAKAKKAAIDAELEAAKAQYPSLSAPPSGTPTGKVEVKSPTNFFESDILAYSASHHAALTLVAELRAKGHVATDTPVVIGSSADLDAIYRLQAFFAQQALLHQAYQDAFVQVDKYFGGPLTTRSFGAGIEAADSIIKSAISLVSLFRTDVDVAPSTVTPDELAFNTDIAGILAGQGIRVSYPSQLYPNLFSAGTIAALQTPAKVQELYADHQKALSLISVLNEDAATLGKKIDEAKKLEEGLEKAIKDEKDAAKRAELQKKLDATQSQRKENEAKQRDAKKGSDLLLAANAQFDRILATLFLADQNAATSLANLMRAELLYDFAFCGERALATPGAPETLASAAPCKPSDKVRFLLAGVPRAGGSYMTKRSLWTFFGGPQLFHSGGIVARYALFDSKGSLLAAGLLPEYKGFVKNGRVESYVDGVMGECIRENKVLGKAECLSK